MYKLLITFSSGNHVSDITTSEFLFKTIEQCFDCLSEFKNVTYWEIVELRDLAIVRSSSATKKVSTNVQIYDNDGNRVINNDLDSNSVYDYLKSTVNPYEVKEIRIKFWK